MKSLIILLLLGVSALTETPKVTPVNNQDFDMQLSSEKVFQEKIKIYDYSGTLLKEYALTEVVNGDISTSDHFALEESDYAFNYLGDYYYFSEGLSVLGAN